MSDEETQVDTIDQDAPGQSDIETAEAKPVDLPTDPVALRQIAEQQQADLIKARQEARRNKQEAERQTERAIELETKATYWATEATRKQAEPVAPAAKAPEKPKPVDIIKGALKGKDLSEYVVDEEHGFERLATDLVESVMKPIVSTMLDERVNQERTMTAQEQAEYREVGEKFPDLAIKDSKLAKETFALMGTLATEKPHLSNSERLELAASRAAANIGYVKPKKDAPQPSNDRDRLRNGQGGPANRGGGDNFPSLTVTEADRKRARQVTGQNMPDDWILANKKEVAARSKA